MTWPNGSIAFWSGKWSRLAMALVLVWTTAVHPVFAQTSSGDTAQPKPPEAADTKPGQAGADQAKLYSLTDLEYLLGPIALYPDPLLALILPASTFHDEIVDAARWLAGNPQAAERGDFAEVDAKPWDSSVQALTRFPDVIKMLSEHLDWTESLGWAYSVQPTDVATAIQMLRAKAETLGNLQSTPEQVVTTREEAGSRVIYIAPANPERVYVPVYDSSAVFDSALTGALVFGTGVLVGSAWNNRWGWNNRNWNQVWIGRPPARPIAPPPGAWRPDRPGVRPDRPGLRPDRPIVRPDRPGTRPDRPAARPERPGVRPERPGTRPERPAVRPERPVARPNRPAARPDSRPTRPQAGGRPGSSRPSSVQRPQGARPQQRARPQRVQARPQQRARPQQPRARSQQSARPQQRRASPQQRGRTN